MNDHDPIPTGDWGGQQPQADIPLTIRRRLNWGDSDTAEIGYAANFVNFAEEAIERWWEAVLDTNWYELKRDNKGNPMVGVDLNIVSPMVAGDRMDVSIRVAHLGRTSIHYWVEGFKVGGGLSFSGTFKHVLVEELNAAGISAIAWPDDWRLRIEGYIRECGLADKGVKSKRQVLDFWFLPPGAPERGQRREIWFAKQKDGGSEFDAQIREHFEATYTAAAAGELDHWMASREGCLALCLLLDQFPRNMYRGSARAYETDAKARALARHVLDKGFDTDLDYIPGVFFYLPFEHSEDLADQNRCLELISRFDPEAEGKNIVKYARAHKDLIERFGRFPHRNAALGRESTAGELEYLQDPEAGF
jgi:uncharacterized protein (DUF924 family)/acyl-CoA thioesterase FadM